MNPKKNIPNMLPPNPENPFRVPEGYFVEVQKRVMERIRSGAQIEEVKSGFNLPGKESSDIPGTGEEQRSGVSAGQKVFRRRKIYLQPYIALAASISGVALVVYIVLQSVMGSRAGDDTYDIAMLDRAGIVRDESILAEAYNVEDETATYSEWDEEAITYLSSNEVDLLNLLDAN